MNDLIEVNYDKERPTILGRDLHVALKISTRYNDWIQRMVEYGFVEGLDYYSILSNRVDGLAGKPRSDHQLTIDMAKQICMIQRTEIGKKYREYFLEVERRWNSPEAVFNRALQFANRQMEVMKLENARLLDTIAVQNQQIAEMKPKASYYDVVLACKDALPITSIAKDYGWSGKKLNKWLKDKGVQYKQGKIWLLYQKYAEKGFTCTRTLVYPDNNGESHAAVHTYWTQKGRLFIYELMKRNGVLPLMERDQKGGV